MPRATQRERLLKLARPSGIVAARDAAARGIHGQVLSRMVADGVLERVARGRYRLAGTPRGEQHGLVLAALAVPNGVICLLSALSFHELGTQLPREVWVAIGRRARRPVLAFPPLRVVRFSDATLGIGVETHTLEGQTLRVTSVAKTLADCFKYRHKIGLDVALEALREAWRERRCTMTEILHFARVCRVERVMRPYLEALVA